MRHTAHLFAALAALLLCGCSDITVGTNNSRPEAAILTPESGFSLPEGAALTFEGQASDRLSDPTELRVRWSSSIDGELHEGYADAEGLTEFTSSELSGGLHTITLRVLDPDGAARATVRA